MYSYIYIFFLITQIIKVLHFYFTSKNIKIYIEIYNIYKRMHKVNGRVNLKCASR